MSNTNGFYICENCDQWRCSYTDSKVKCNGKQFGCPRAYALCHADIEYKSDNTGPVYLTSAFDRGDL